MLLFLVLEGKYTPSGSFVTNCTSRRLVSVNLANREELADLGRFRTDTGAVCWGLGDVNNGWWRVVEAFEFIEPTEALHEKRYRIATYLDDHDIADVVKTAREQLGPDSGTGCDAGVDAPYYLVVEEWNYPTESGREPSQLTYDGLDEAISACRELAEAERGNFTAVTGLDCLPPETCDTGYILTTRMGLDPFYYLARVVPVMSRMGRVLEETNDNLKRAREL